MVDDPLEEIEKLLRAPASREHRVVKLKRQGTVDLGRFYSSTTTSALPIAINLSFLAASIAGLAVFGGNLHDVGIKLHAALLQKEQDGELHASER